MCPGSNMKTKTLWVHAENCYMKFCLAEGQSLPSPIDFAGRPYNCATLPRALWCLYRVSVLGGCSKHVARQQQSFCRQMCCVCVEQRQCVGLVILLFRLSTGQDPPSTTQIDRSPTGTRDVLGIINQNVFISKVWSEVFWAGHSKTTWLVFFECPPLYTTCVIDSRSYYDVGLYTVAYQLLV